MLIIPNGKEPKEPKFDTVAGQQIFDKVHTRENSPQTLTVSKDSSNPIEVRLRQLALDPTTPIDIKREFCDKWAAALVMKGPRIFIYKGRIKDIFMTRDVYIKTRKGEDIIVQFDNVMEVSEREI